MHFKKMVTRRDFNKIGVQALLGMGGALGWASAPFASGQNASGKMIEARYYRKLNGRRVQCDLCFRRCVVSDGQRGFCRNRENRNGIYYSVVYGKPSALQVDPIEKEPCYHMWPGTRIFCTGTAGCNNRCRFCHNWHLSQQSLEDIDHTPASPEDIVSMAKQYGCESLSFTYNEPTVFYEYVFDVAKVGQKNGLGVLCHTNGLINQAPLLALLDHLNAVSVDLKAFTENFYKKVCSSRLKPVLDTLRTIRQSGKHLEIVYLMIPTLNDDPEEIRQMCRWLVENLGAETPLHYSRFFPNYKLTHLPPTPIETLEKAHETAMKEGLHYVTIGNVPGHTYNSTFCPQCRKKVIHRVHFEVRANYLKKGQCGFCGYPIAGVWRLEET